MTFNFRHICLLFTLLASNFLSAQLLTKIQDYDKGFPEYGKEKLYQDKRGFIWLAGANGFHRWDGKVWKKINLFDNINLNDQQTTSVLETRDGIYFFTCGPNGIVIYDPSSDKKTHISEISIDGMERSFYAHDVTHTYGYKQLIATVQGLIVMDNKGSVISLDRPGVKYADQNSSGHNPNAIRKGFLDSESGIYYYGGNAGLFARDVNQDSILHFPMTFYNAAMPDGKGNHQIQDMWKDGDNLVCTTWGAGIAVFNTKTSVWKDYRFSKDPGKSVTISLLKIQEGTFLTTQVYQNDSRSAINLFQYGRDELIPLLNKDGNPFEYANAIEKDVNNQIWVGEKNKVSHYTYDGLPLLNNPASVYIYDFEVEGKKVPSQLGLYDGQVLYLNPGDNQISLSFRAVNATDYEPIFYEYKLRNASVLSDEDRWISNQSSENLVLSSKGMGKVTFQVRCINPHTGNYIFSKPLTLVKRKTNLNSLQTWGLICISFTGLIILSIILVNYLNHRKSSKIESQLRTLALRSQMNPHFLFNCLNSIRYFIVKNENKSAIKYLSKFSTLLRATLENTEKDLVPIGQEIKMIQLYLEMEKLRFDDKFEYIINSASIKDPLNTKIPPMLIQPFVENALIHGIKNLEGKGKIEVNLLKTGGNLEIIIKDNGIGRQMAKLLARQSTSEKTSLATKITSERIKLLETSKNHRIEFIDLVDDNNKPNGTLVRIILPLQ